MTPAGRRESDPRAEALLARFSARFGPTEGAVPVDALATDLLGLLVIESDGIEVSGLLVPATRYVYLNARESRESEGRRRFTLAHEIGLGSLLDFGGVKARGEQVFAQVGSRGGHQREGVRAAARA